MELIDREEVLSKKVYTETEDGCSGYTVDDKDIEQLPTIQAVPIEVLDKIRAEIEQTADEEQKYDEKWAIGLRYAVKIIDKYRGKDK